MARQDPFRLIVGRPEMLAMSVEGAGAAKQVEAIKTEGKSVP
jgi:hypothetical protein